MVYQMQRGIKKRSWLYGVAAVLLAVVLVSLCYNLGYVPQVQPATAYLKTFSSYAEFVDFLEVNSQTRGLFPFYGPLDVQFFAESGSNLLKTPAVSVEYSTTNIQVAGVDEADTVKTDGEYIYLVSGNNVTILKAFPPAEAGLISRISFNDTNPVGIFVDGDRLVVLGCTYNTYPDVYYVRFYGDTATFANVYDISDRANPELLRTFQMNGSYFNSRKIGNYVYFVISEPAYLINETVALPKICSDGDVRELSPQEIHYINFSDNYFAVTTFVALNTQDTSEEPTHISLMMGGTSNMYVSLDNIYVTFPQDTSTAIYRIHIENNNMTCEAQGNVLGHELNQFSMDEYNNYFRIATTTWANRFWWMSTKQNSVYVLNMNLEIVGKLENLANNEDLHSARFMGDRCYLVTFKKVDPLFVIDLTEPSNPAVLGQLKIPGFSDYLHPYDENHLIGVGKETVEAEEGDFAWYQGVKISIFDVSDVNSPEQLANYTIGDRGSDSPILSDHKAFLFDRTKNLLVVPVLVAQVDETQYPYGVPSNAYGQPVWQGAYVFDISLERGLVFRGGISHVDSQSHLQNSNYWVKRSLYIENILYTISDVKVELSGLTDLAFIKDINLN
jgi:inhibitor of cysteine peptidase